MTTRRNSSNYVTKDIGCSNGDCDVWTKVTIAKNFDDSLDFLCGFCAASELTKLRLNLTETKSTNNASSYADITRSFKDPTVSAALADEITQSLKVPSVCASIIDKVQLEERLQKAKSANLVIHGVNPPEEGDTADSAFVRKLGATLSVDLTPDSFNVKRVPTKPGRDKHVMIVTFVDLNQRLSLLRKAKDLRDFSDYAGIFINPDLTHAERQKQFELRQQLRCKRASDPHKTWIIQGNRVVSKSGGKFNVEPTADSESK